MPPVKTKAAISFFEVLNSSASLRIKFLKLMDRTIGSLIIFFLKASKPDNQSKPLNKILIIRPGGIGDAVWVLPFIKILKKKTDCQIDVLCEGRNKAIFDLCPKEIRNIWTYDGGGWGFLKDLKSQNYDWVLDTEQYHNFSAIFAYLSSDYNRVGFDTVPQRSKLYTHRVAYDQQSQEYAMFLKMLNVIVPVTSREYFSAINVDVPGLDIKLAGQDLTGKALVTLYIGASIKERYWGTDKFAQLGKCLVEAGHTVVLIGGKEDRSKADHITNRYRHDQLIDLVGKIPLHQTAAVLKKSRLVVGADSGIMHLASLVQCPGVWLFGAGIEKKWFPNFGMNEAINVNLPCSPCTLFGYTPHCPYDVKCLKDISVEQVLEKIKIIRHSDLK